MIFKKLIASIFFVFLTLKIFSYSFEEIKDIDKIRWIDCGEDNFDLPLTDMLTFSFKIYPALRYYKIFDLKNTEYRTLGEGEEYTVTEGTFYLYYEYKPNYFVTNFTEYYYNYLLQRKESYFTTKKGYKLSIFELDDTDVYVREDNKPFSVDDLCKKYLKTSDKDLYTIIAQYETNDYAGTVSVTDKNHTIKERGDHFIVYSPNDSTFYSDSFFYNKGYEFKNTGNDCFSIKVLKYNDNEKLLLLDTPKYTRPYVPMEDFFTPDTSGVCIEKPYAERNEKILFYTRPDFNSEVIKSFEGKETLYGKVIESKDKFEEYKGKMSKWVKVRLNDGLEGWVWGRDVNLYDWSSGYDYEKVKRYAQYNTVK